MLLTLLYHRIGNGKYSNSFDMMKAHLKHVSKNYSVVLPGESLKLLKVQVCLTFDDAFFDFFHYVYPLLKELRIRAILAVPTKYILERTDIDPKTRLSVPTHEAEKVYNSLAPYCTWEELREMHNSGYVKIASHSHSHTVMDRPDKATQYEFFHSKKLLEEKLQSNVSIFVFPYGKLSKASAKLAGQHYKYMMRIGSASNTYWKTMLYRINADQMLSHKSIFDRVNYMKYFSKWALNQLRGK